MQSLVGKLWQGFLYFLFVLVVSHLVAVEGYSLLTDSVYGEASLTEKMQIAFSGICCVLFLATARMSRKLRPIAVMLAALTGMMFIREADLFLDENVFDGAWQTLVVFVLIALAIYLKKQPDPIKPSVEAFSRLPSAGVLLSGCLVTFVFSRLFGRRSFWEAVMGEGYMEVVKDLVEEGTELVGYSLILIAAVDLAWYSRNQLSALVANKEYREGEAQPNVATTPKLILDFEERDLQKNVPLKIYNPQQAEDELLELVQQQGFSEGEAGDLVDSWRLIFRQSRKRAA